MKVSTPQTSATRLRSFSNRMKVWTREVSARAAAKGHEPSNLIYLLAAITLGIPALLAIPLIGMNSATRPGAFTSIMAALVVTGFVITAVFEIKRLVDEPSNEERH